MRPKSQGPGENAPASTPNPEQDIVTRYFSPPEDKLVSILEFLQPYQTVLQAGIYLSRVFGLPLISDIKASGISSLFSKCAPQILEIEQAECSTVNWVDILRSPIYNPQLQENGEYHVRIEKANALVILSKDDHDFIATGLPRQLIDPQSYPGDLTSEMNTVKLAIAQISHWKALTVDLTETIDNVLVELSKRMDTLAKKDLTSGLQQNSPNHAEISSDASIPAENTESSQTPQQGKRRKISWFFPAFPSDGSRFWILFSKKMADFRTDRT
ncbi:uncharacterized protein N7459_010106 [Penicillium hispanicum]|uniref:uncharacterized protein n=1 Tax=Penicillium hispanicum TaxID=1080232 RepID=UPI00253FBA58|nr:uncharacterized protein N7459_010106 [Penicillium hispanicum]KAJ5566724.1 hypothetical protein N7459_010106 [Penicillium hispanicum]